MSAQATRKAPGPRPSRQPHEYRFEPLTYTPLAAHSTVSLARDLPRTVPTGSMLVRRSLAALEERIYQLLICREHLLALIQDASRLVQPRRDQSGTFTTGARRRRRKKAE